MPRKKKARGGGRLGRTETVTIRLDPKLNYLADIAARSQRRTKSSLMEAALAEALHLVKVDSGHDPNARTVAGIGEELWHVDEWDRLQRLANYAPHLMTFEEQKIWAVISKNSFFWLGRWCELDSENEYFAYEPTPQSLLLYNVEQHWELIKKVAAGEAKSEQLPQGAFCRRKPGLEYSPGALANALMGGTS